MGPAIVTHSHTVAGRPMARYKPVANMNVWKRIVIAEVVQDKTAPRRHGAVTLGAAMGERVWPLSSGE